jgi:hypothetical protein
MTLERRLSRETSISLPETRTGQSRQLDQQIQRGR